MSTVNLGSQSRNVVESTLTSIVFTTTSFANIMSINMELSGLTPVMILLNPESAVSVTGNVQITKTTDALSAIIRLDDGTVNIGLYQLQFQILNAGSTDTSLHYSPGGFVFIDSSPSKGSVTYQLDGRIENAVSSESLRMSDVTLTGIEL